MAAEVRVDWIRCEAFGMCHDLAPDLIALDEWGYPLLDPDGIPERRVGDAQRAVDCCPVAALRLVREGERDRSRSARRRYGVSQTGYSVRWVGELSVDERS